MAQPTDVWGYRAGECTSAGLAAARRLGRTGGRPAKLTDDDLDVATTLLANPDITVAEVAERVGVSPATLYRYLPAAKERRYGSQPGINSTRMEHRRIMTKALAFDKSDA